MKIIERYNPVLIIENTRPTWAVFRDDGPKGHFTREIIMWAICEVQEYDQGNDQWVTTKTKTICGVPFCSDIIEPCEADSGFVGFVTHLDRAKDIL